MTDYDYDLDLGSIPGVQGDPTVVEVNYKSWSDGTYKAKGIHSYIKKDDRDLPIFVPQGDHMVGRFRLIVLQKDEETGNEVEVEGPPMSATQNQIRMLVAAFGGDISKLGNEMTSSFLLTAQVESTAKGIVRDAGVKGGWVKWVQGMNPPLGKESFMWGFRGFWNTTSSTPVSFITVEREGKNGKYPDSGTYAKFELISDAWGNPSPYAGYEINIKFKNPYDGGVMGMEGNLVPSMESGQKGGIPKHVERWLKFIALLVGHQYKDRHWESDPEKSEYGINELENPLAVVNALALKSLRKNKLIAVLGATKTGGPKLDIDDMTLYKGPEILDRDVQQAAESKQPKELLDLVEYIDRQAGFPVFVPTPKDAAEIDLTFTNEGRDWAKQNLVSAWDELKLPITNGARQLGTLDKTQLAALLDHLKSGGAAF